MMTKIIEKQLTKKLCKIIKASEKPFAAKNFLIVLFEDYLNLQPAQKHFF
jgi:hypothetical protein